MHHLRRAGSLARQYAGESASSRPLLLGERAGLQARPSRDPLSLLASSGCEDRFSSVARRLAGLGIPGVHSYLRVPFPMSAVVHPAGETSALKERTGVEGDTYARAFLCLDIPKVLCGVMYVVLR